MYKSHIQSSVEAAFKENFEAHPSEGHMGVVNPFYYVTNQPTYLPTYLHDINLKTFAKSLLLIGAMSCCTISSGHHMNV